MKYNLGLFVIFPREQTSVFLDVDQICPKRSFELYLVFFSSLQWFTDEVDVVR